ncbi:sigma-70 family RNA polymerase sigma factor [Streptomyces sp. PSKA54]|uniref:RNA polymerase sigma factor n=1 Tax=Streptomyces himalayensis subsp. aureolus TaxID=2758039 RepID=A0A7W2HFG9_9ACTN|nr:sigma-70 family RNA polymerase sigma factor [Streptomyces himalayensis]MBA4861973.1 sigma-70 family RNA polymerase sigma factor [Streptomyces himalayensis subsp. aureolus]
MTPSLIRPPRGRTRPHSDTQVTEWALAARDGDQEAFESFVRATRGDVGRFVAYLRGDGDPHGTDDLTQETYLRTLTALPRFAGRSCARTWLLAIARRVVVDRYRSAAVRPRIADTRDWQAAAEHTQAGGLPGFEEGVALLDLLRSLDAPRREAFVLTQLLGLPYAEAACAVGCPVGTVRSRVARAREDMNALLRQAEAPHTPKPTVPDRRSGGHIPPVSPARRVPHPQIPHGG